MNIKTLLFLLLSITTFGQPKHEWGPKFDYDEKKEIDPKVVLVDNYNHYMVSVINIDGGMMPTNKIIIRKFDQKNQLVNTFTEEFPYKDVFTLHNYLGSFELGSGKLVVFTDCYSNKTKKKEIHKIIFDKKTSTFTTTVVAEFTFESISKSGTTYIMPSQNKNYIGIVYGKFSNKKIAEEFECIVLDGKTSDVVWQKNIAFPLLSFTGNIVLNNTGKFVFIRNSKETGSKNIIAVVDAKTIENKDFGDKLSVQKPIAFSIGAQDYLIAFNNSIQTISMNGGDYSNILLYDLNSGTILKNNYLKDFITIKDLQKVNLNSISVKNNEIHLFVDCEVKTGTKPDPKFPNSTFTVPIISNANPSVLIFTMQGELKNIVNYNVLPSNKNFIKCFNVENIKGNYYTNTWIKYGGQYYQGVYKLNESDLNLNYPTAQKFEFNYNSELKEYREGRQINQFSNYLPDSKRLILAKYYDTEGKIAFVNVTGIDL